MPSIKVLLASVFPFRGMGQNRRPPLSFTPMAHPGAPWPGARWPRTWMIPPDRRLPSPVPSCPFPRTLDAPSILPVPGTPGRWSWPVTVSVSFPWAGTLSPWASHVKLSLHGWTDGLEIIECERPFTLPSLPSCYPKKRVEGNTTPLGKSRPVLSFCYLITLIKGLEGMGGGLSGLCHNRVMEYLWIMTEEGREGYWGARHLGREKDG
jgi:hypothetical protein